MIRKIQELNKCKKVNNSNLYKINLLIIKIKFLIKMKRVNFKTNKNNFKI